MLSELFARIGLAIQHLADNSPINGPSKEEVMRLAAELQAFEGNIGATIDSRIQAAIEAMEGRTHAYIDQGFSDLALALEQQANITFTPPAPPVLAPARPDLGQAAAAPEPVAEEAPPAPTTGNIPAVPVEEVTATAEPEAQTAPQADLPAPILYEQPASVTGNTPADSETPHPDATYDENGRIVKPDPEAEATTAADAAPEATIDAGAANDTINGGAQTDSAPETTSDAAPEAETVAGGQSEDAIEPDAGIVSAQETTSEPQTGDGSVSMVADGGSDVVG